MSATSPAEDTMTTTKTLSIDPPASAAACKEKNRHKLTIKVAPVVIQVAPATTKTSSCGSPAAAGPASKKRRLPKRHQLDCPRTAVVPDYLRCHICLDYVDTPLQVSHVPVNKQRLAFSVFILYLRPCAATISFVKSA